MVLSIAVQAGEGALGQARGLPEDVNAILSEHCFSCHGPDKQKGKVRLDNLSTDLVTDRAAGETWHDVMNALSIGEMPPDGEPDLSAGERQRLTGWIREKIADASVPGQHIEKPKVRRLTKGEYRYTMEDLLGMPGNYGESLPADTLAENGFANQAESLHLSALQLECYLEEARSALADVIELGDRPARIVLPPVTESSKDVSFRAGEKGAHSKVLGRAQHFAATFGVIGHRDEVPASGRFTIRVKAKAALAAGAANPRLEVVYGVDAHGVLPVYEKVGELEISSRESQVYEFHGLVSRFPTARGLGRKWFQFVGVRNGLMDGIPPEKKGVGQKARYPMDPQFPKVEVESVQFLANTDASFPPEEHQRIFCSESVPEIIGAFLNRAWRRPVRESEVATYFRHYEQIRPHVASREAAVLETLAAALTSPGFLFLMAPGADPATGESADYQLASRLSYFLWSSMPDDALFSLAAEGRLNDPAVLRNEVSRMLADRRSRRFVEEFTTQWLDLAGLERVAVNPQYYPEFDNELKDDMIEETQAFFAEVLYNDLSALQFIEADWTMVNARLARHYQLTGPHSQKTERVVLEEGQRPGGLLAHASMHLANSNGEDSHPINRAVWIRERLLDDPPLPPPPNVPALDSTDPDFARLSIREQLQLHREDPACADCHRGIDPWGIALDHFDAVGLWRDRIKRPSVEEGKFEFVAVDPRDSLPDGETLDGLPSLQTYLLGKRRDQFARALVSRFLAYAIGRPVTFEDTPVVDQLTRQFSAEGFRLSVLIEAIVLSEPFRGR